MGTTYSPNVAATYRWNDKDGLYELKSVHCTRQCSKEESAWIMDALRESSLVRQYLQGAMKWSLCPEYVIVGGRAWVWTSDWFRENESEESFDVVCVRHSSREDVEFSVKKVLSLVDTKP